MGPQGWQPKFVQHIAEATCISPSTAGPGSCPLHLLHLCDLCFVTRMPNRRCILELRVHKYFACNFLSVPRCQCKIAQKETQCPAALHEISEIC